jgi:hypothetical protein
MPAAAAAAAADLVRDLVAGSRLTWGGTFAGQARSTSRVASDYSGDPVLGDLVGAVL